MSARLVIEGLGCGRAGRLVVMPPDMTLRLGEALVVTGRNGAGKSTFLRTLAGLLPPVRGRVIVDGLAYSDDEQGEIGDAIHYLGHRNALKPGRTVQSELLFWARFLEGRSRSVEDVLNAVDLPGFASVRCGDLSAGQARRVALARLLIVYRPIWLLDEPTNALDDAAQTRFADLCRSHLDMGGIIVAATHQPLGLDARRLHLEAAQPMASNASVDADSWDGYR